MNDELHRKAIADTIAGIMAAARMMGDYDEVTLRFLESTLARMDERQIATLWGVAVIVKHAVEAKMPQQWLDWLLSELDEALVYHVQTWRKLSALSPEAADPERGGGAYWMHGNN